MLWRPARQNVGLVHRPRGLAVCLWWPPVRYHSRTSPKGLMGFNPGTLDLVVSWAKRFGALPPGSSVLDIGTSQLFCEDDPASLNRFLVHFGAVPYENADLAQMAKGGFAGRLFQRAGFHS